ILLPLVANAENEMAIFQHWVKTGCVIKPPCQHMPGWLHDIYSGKQNPTRRGIHAYTLKFDIPKSYQPCMMEWSRSNLEIRFAVEYDAGQRFLNTRPNL